MKYTRFVWLVLIMLTTQKIKASDKPNIIILFADDISARELPFYGSSVWSPPTGGNTSDPAYRAHTPVLDKLAAEGCMIKTTWAATVCSPSRAMMMTGRYAHLHKWWINKDVGTKTLKNGKKVAWPFYESSPYTIGAVAKQGGYATFWAGKTQMKGGDLRRYGFDEGCFTPGENMKEPNPYTDFYLKQTKMNGKKVLVNADGNLVLQRKSYKQSSWYWQPFVLLMNQPGQQEDFVWWPNTPEDKKEYGLNTFGPDVELNFVFDFMQRAHKAGKPFFIYHTSHLGHDAYNFINPQNKSKWPGTPKIQWDGKAYHRTTPNITGDNGKYNLHGTVTASGIHHHINYLDYQVWLYMNKLKEMGIEKNTIFIFCADNGTWGYGKHSPVCQKGTHVPFLIYAPGSHLTKKGPQDIIANIADVLPTIADIAGVTLPADYEVNGVSLWPYVTTKKENHRDWIYAYHQDKQLIRGQKVMRDGNGTWYDITTHPDDLISFQVIKDWSGVSADYKAERDKLKSILPRFDKYHSEHDAPVSN